MTEQTFFDFVKKDYKIIALVFAALLLPSFIFFGATGLKTFLGIIILFFIPFFLIFYSLSLELSEKIFFSLFIGLVVFSMILWYIDRIFHNIYLSSIVTGLLFYGIGIYLSVIKVKRRKQD